MTETTNPTIDDLAAMATLAAECQRDPTRHCIYVSTDAEPIAHEITSTPEWRENARVIRDDRGVAAWLLAEIDADMGRVWWWGPFVAQRLPFGPTADVLYAAVRRHLDGAITEEELAADTRHVDMGAFAERHGFTRAVASSVLSCFDDLPDPGDEIRDLDADDHAVVIQLHDDAFPGTHTPGRLLVTERPESFVLVATDLGEVTGYVACQRSADGEGYIDFLAVDPSRRGTGIGARLVAAAVRRLRRAGATSVHLTVREDNAAARSLYGRLGFTEERLARPYRIGFGTD